jgi:hypothetical protein
VFSVRLLFGYCSWIPCILICVALITSVGPGCWFGIVLVWCWHSGSSRGPYRARLVSLGGIILVPFALLFRALG